jgi:hypothetical protein
VRASRLARGRQTSTSNAGRLTHGSGERMLEVSPRVGRAALMLHDCTSGVGHHERAGPCGAPTPGAELAPTIVVRTMAVKEGS